MEPTSAPSETQTTAPRISWRDVVVLDSDGATPLDEAGAVSALREYRQHGSIAGRFLGRVGLPTEDPDDASTWGPTVDQIDWDGFPADGSQPTTYHIREECGGETDIRAPTLEAAREQAEEWVREGDYGEIEQTIWVRAWIQREGEDDEEAITVAIDPPEPACRTVGGRPPAHEWEGESVQGHGGGVITTELCARCRLRRTTDTWAQDPETGEQGIESVRYDHAEEEEEE